MSGVDIAGLVSGLRQALYTRKAERSALPDRAADALLAQAADLAEAREAVKREAEDRFSANERCNSLVEQLATATRQRDEALAALKASEERGERLSQELASASCPHETWQDIASAPDENVLVTHGGWVSEARYHPEERGWWLANTDPSDAHDGQVYPTRWMHLPDPPKALENGPARLADATKKDPGTEREAGV